MIDESENLQINLSNGINYELTATFDLNKCTASSFGFLLRTSEKYRTIVECDVASSELVIDRSQSDDFSQGIRRCELKSLRTESVTLHIFVDLYSVEVFTDDGRTVMSCDIFPSEECSGLFVYSKNGSVMCDYLKVWGLNTVLH
jgi:beta-fructofuranosidase